MNIEEISPALPFGDIEWLIPGDIHADTRVTRVDALYLIVKKLLKEKRLKGVIFQGDTLDRVDSQAPKELILFLKHLEESGVRIVILPGNHDPNIKELITSAALEYNVALPSVEFPGSEFHFSVGQKNFLVLHGDVFDNYVQNLKRTSALATWIYARIQALDNEEQSTSTKIKKLSKRILKLGKALAGRAMNYADVHRVDTVVCGHVHISDQHERETNHGTLAYFNAGCFAAKECSMVTITSGGQTTLHAVHTRRSK